jgi:hypothetical protein
VKNQTMKKFLKITGIIILIFILLLAILPFLFQDQIEQSLKKNINKNVNANVEWKSLNLSLFADFPNAEVGLEEVFVTNKKPFEGDTLFYAQNFQLHMGLFQLFNPESLVIDDINIENANLNILINENGEANYNIQKETADRKDSVNNSAEGKFALQLKSYQISNANILYKDAENILLKLDRFNHSGNGDFSKNIFTLETKTDSKVSLIYDNTNYLDNNSIELDADIAIDLDQMKFTFEDNISKVNQLPLNFDGYLQIFEDRQELDIKFTTPDSDFKNLLALVPETYAGNLDGINTKGEFNLEGRLYGKIDDTYIPKIDVELISTNAEFQYDNLPNKMEDINLDMKILNSTGLVEDTAIDINKLDFRIGKDKFSSAVHLKDLTKNIKTDIVAKGVINLAKLSKTYPVDTDLDLNGVLDMDLETHFDMNSIENKQYQNINSKGKLLLSDFRYVSEDIANPFEIKTADLTFNKASAKLNDFQMKTGQTDLKANGQLNNLIGYLFSDEDLTGNFQAMSNKFVLNDFMTMTGTEENTNDKSAKSEKPAEEEAIKIPSKLDLSLNFTANEVVYDNFNLRNAVGKLSVKDQKANLSQIQADLFGGQVVLDGNVSTKNADPTFGVNLKLNKIDIGTSLEQIEMFQGFTPILKSLVGVFSTEFDFSGDMTKGLSPILSTLDGNGLTKIIQARVEPSKVPLASALNSQMELVDFSKLNLQDVVTRFSFENGSINVKPMKFMVEDIEVKLQGSHSLNNLMDYTAELKLPAKYLGSDIKNQIAKLSKSDINTMMLDLPISIKGELKQPQIAIDTKTAINKLTNQIVEEQKNDLINQAGNKINDLIGGNQPKDSTATKNNEVKETVKNVLGGLLKGNKKKGN